MYEGGLKVPTCMSWPGHIPAGSSSDRISLTMDIYPTLLEVADLPIPSLLEGQSFLPTLLGESTNAPLERPLYFSRREGGTRYGGQSIYAVRLGDWKLLQNSPYEPYELYHLAEDSLEVNNLVAEQTDIYQKLNALLMQHIQKGGSVPWQGPSVTEE